MNLAAERGYLRDLGRAFAGALLFNIPLLMTMEIWEQGVTMGRWRLLLFIGVGLPLIYGMAFYAGFSKRRGLVNDLLDTAVGEEKPPPTSRSKGSRKPAKQPRRSTTSPAKEEAAHTSASKRTPEWCASR